jgi:hypothetical protein
VIARATGLEGVGTYWLIFERAGLGLKRVVGR